MLSAKAALLSVIIPVYMEAITHLDHKILNSDCPHDLKLKYIEKRDTMTYVVEHQFEYACYKLHEKFNSFFGWTYEE